MQQGLAAWSKSLRDPDEDYLGRNPDVAACKMARGFMSGVDHYLQHGYEEMRSFSYCAPAFMPFARANLLLPVDFYRILDEARDANDAKASAAAVCALITQIVDGGSVYAAYHLATFLCTRPHADKRGVKEVFEKICRLGAHEPSLEDRLRHAIAQQVSQGSLFPWVTAAKSASAGSNAMSRPLRKSFYLSV